MNIDKDAIFQAVIDRDPEWQTLVNESWSCLNVDDRRRVLVLAVMTGEDFAVLFPTSTGGNGAADDGKSLIFGTDGSIRTSGPNWYSKDGGAAGVIQDPSNLTGERTHTLTDASGFLSVLIDTVPADSDAAGIKGTYAVDGDYLYYYEHVLGKWRRCSGNIF